MPISVRLRAIHYITAVFAILAISSTFFQYKGLEASQERLLFENERSIETTFYDMIKRDTASLSSASDILIYNNEIKKIFKEMAEERPRKYETKPEIAAVMKELWNRKEARSMWKQGKNCQTPNG